MGRLNPKTRGGVVQEQRRWNSKDESVYVSKVALFRKYEATRSIQDRERSSRPQLLNENQYTVNPDIYAKIIFAF